MRRSLVVVAVLSGLPALSCACRQAPAGQAVPAAVPVVAPAAAGAAPRDTPSASARVPGEYLVTMAAGSGEAALREAFGRFGITGLESLGGGLFRVTLSGDPGPAGLEEAGRKDARIRAVQPNFVYKAN
jgi:hypothetical protein